MAEAPKPETATAAATPERLLSLDVLRGLTVLGMIVVNSAAGMKYGAEAEVFAPLLHAHWDGLMLADLVFPAFLMMVGVSIPLSMRRAQETPRAVQLRRIFGRTVRLLVLGFILSNLWWMSDFEATDWRLFGVLQRTGLAYGACALLFLYLGPRSRAGIAAAILLLYWPLTLLPALDGLATDIWVRGHTFAASVDRLLLGGGHIYVKGPEGYDPEGLLGTLPSIAHGLIGIAVGEFMMRRRGAAQTWRLAGAGALMIVVGIAWGQVFPIVKDLWSSSFVLVTCGITIIAAASLHLWLDGAHDFSTGKRIVAAIALPFGVNAIAAYVLHMVTADVIGWDLLLAPFHATRGAIGDGLASLIPVLLILLFLWAAMEWLRRKDWIIKV